MNILMFIAILFGGDKLGIHFDNRLFRLSQLIFLLIFIIFILFNKYRLYKRFTLAYFFILFPHLISLIYTKSFKNSFLYLIWIIFNYFIVITPVINWSSNKRRDWIIEKYFLVFRIVGVLTILQFICGGFGIVVPFFQNDSYKGIFRPALWFYEPSYLATYFSLYMGMSLVGFLYNKKNIKRFDFILDIYNVYYLNNRVYSYIYIINFFIYSV